MKPEYSPIFTHLIYSNNLWLIYMSDMSYISTFLHSSEADWVHDRETNVFRLWEFPYLLKTQAVIRHLRQKLHACLGIKNPLPLKCFLLLFRIFTMCRHLCKHKKNFCGFWKKFDWIKDFYFQPLSFLENWSCCPTVWPCDASESRKQRPTLF